MRIPIRAAVTSALVLALAGTMLHWQPGVADGSIQEEDRETTNRQDPRVGRMSENAGNARSEIASHQDENPLLRKDGSIHVSVRDRAEGFPLSSATVLALDGSWRAECKGKTSRGGWVVLKPRRRCSGIFVHTPGYFAHLAACSSSAEQPASHLPQCYHAGDGLSPLGIEARQTQEQPCAQPSSLFRWSWA